MQDIHNANKKNDVKTTIKYYFVTELYKTMLYYKTKDINKTIV